MQYRRQASTLSKQNKQQTNKQTNQPKTNKKRMGWGNKQTKNNN